MSSNRRILKFEWDAKGEKIELQLNQDGLKYFISLLEALSKKEGPEHLHLMTPSWGGDELSEGAVEKGYVLSNHVKIYKIE